MITEQHKKFLARLSASSDAVFAVARWLHSKGKTVKIPAVQFAPTASEAEGYFDHGDIIVDPDTTEKIVQVKQISRPFTGANDWPFKEAFVSNAAAVERLGGAVAAYVTVNPDKSAAAIVPADTHPSWYLKEVLAKNTGNVERFYVCPLNEVKFVRLV